MRLHYSRTVLAAVVWTILLNGSAAESIGNDSTGRRTIERSNNEREKTTSACGKANGNTSNDGVRGRSKAGSVSPVAAASAHVIMEDVADATGKSKPALSINTPPSLSYKPEEPVGKNSSLTAEKVRDHYDNDEPGIPAPIAANPRNPTPSGANTTVSRGTNEGTNDRFQPSVSKAPKADETRTPNGKTNHRATGEKFEQEKRVTRLVAVYQSSDASMQHVREEGDHFPSQSSISSTTEYPGAPSTADGSTDSGISFPQDVRSLPSIKDRRFSSEDTSRSIAALSRKEIDPGNQGEEESEENAIGYIATPPNAVIGQAEENSGIDESGGNMKKADSPVETSGADKVDLRPAENRNADVAPSTPRKRQRGTTDLGGKKNYRAEPLDNERKIAPSRPPDFHTVPVPVEQPRRFSEGPRGKTSEPRDTDTTSSPVNRQFGDLPKSLIRNYLQRQIAAQTSWKKSFSPVDVTGNPRKINNPERAKNKRDFYSNNGESGETNGERTAAADKNKAAGNEVLRAEKFSAAKNKLVGAGGTRGIRVPSPEGQVDNAVNPDSRARGEIHGSVVTDAFTGWQMKNTDHKILISRVAAVGGFNRRRWPGERVSVPGIQERRVFTEMDPLGRDGSAVRASVARVLQNTGNSKDFTLAVEASNDVSNSISRTTERAEGMKFSADKLEDTGGVRKVATSGEGLVVTSGTGEATKPRGPPGHPDAVEGVVNDTDDTDGTRGVMVTEENPGKSLGKVDRPISTDAPRSTGDAFQELRPGDLNSGDHRDCKRSRCSDRSKMELSAGKHEDAGSFVIITAGTEELTKPPESPGQPETLERVVNGTADTDDTRGANITSKNPATSFGLKFDRPNGTDDTQGVKIAAENPANPFGFKIERQIPTNAPRSTGVVFPKLRPGDVKPGEHRDGEESECSDRGKMTKGIERSGGKRAVAAFSRCVKNASGSRVDPGDERKDGGAVVIVAVSSDGQRKRKRWKGGSADAQPGAVDPFVAVLLKVRNEEITDVTGADSSDGNRRKNEYEGFFRRANYTREAKINDASGAQTANRSGLRDATVVNGDDAPELPGESRSHIAGVMTFDVEPCETCKTVAIAENETRNEHDEYSDGFGGGNGENGGEMGAAKVDPSTGVFRESKGTTRGEVSRGNGISVVPATGNNRARSLGRPGAEFKSIDPRGPEARDPRIMHRANGDRLVRGQKAIFIKPKEANVILPGERVAHQRLSVGQLSAPDAAALRLPDESLENSSKSLDDHAASDPEKAVGANEEQTQKQEHRSSITGFTVNLVETRSPGVENFNAGTDAPGDHENFGTHSTSQTRSSFGRPGRRRKSVGHKSSTSSTKTDSVESAIDGPEYREGYATGGTNRPHSQLGVSDAGPGNNGSVGQIKGGFTTLESAVTAGALRSSNGSGSWIDWAIPEVRDVKSTEAIMRTSGDVPTMIEPSGIHPATETSVGSVGTHPRKTADTTVDEISSENAATPGAVNPDSTFMESMERVKSSMNRGGGGSTDLQQLQTKQTSENDGIVMGAGGSRPFNYSGSDNSTRAAATSNQWPVKYSAVVEGDLVLGGLMMVHEREDSVTCGPVMPQGGVQALEAMLYTLDWVNKRDLVPGVKIGAHILDDCDKDTYGLEMAVDFIKGSISNIDGAEYHCNKTTVRKVISGVVGAASSVTSIQVANLLRLFRIPQVSFFSTSPELSNKMRFEYFTRTIPSDHYQVKAMVDIVRLMGWSYVSIIYEESNYGEKAYEELEKLLGKHQICIAVKEKLSKDSGVAKAHVYDNIVLKLLTKPRARGCIIFASDQEVAGVMKAVRRCNATGAFSWIGSDGWSARSLVSDGNEPEMEGTLSVQPQANPVEGFEDYFLNLTVENNRRNPWFVEFWEDHFKCRYPNASHTPYNNYTEECTTTEKLTKQNTAFENQLQFVSDAVMAFAYAFRNMHADLCHGVRGLCDAMKPTKGTELLSYLRTVQFKGLSGDVFHFDKNGDGPARYNIIHFKQVSPGKYKWIRVGKYLEGELRLNMSEIQFRLGHPEPPESVCSLPCEVGQAKKYVEGESCCWHCFNCTQYQIRNDSDERQCVLCPKGTVPDEMHSYCRDIPENFLRPESGWAIGAMSFSSTGILITLCVGGVFLKHNDTPIVRASGRELSYVLLTGILLCYLVTFALVLRPNDLVCSIQRFSAGFCFTVVYAALLTKTNRISRIFNAGKHSAKRPSFISPRSQLIICSMLVGVQILINGVWMVIDPAKAIHHYPTREDNLLVCNSYIDASYTIAFTYPIILIVVCTVYAVLTRKIPEAFNESKHIGFTMYTTCVIWLAFVPLYFGTGSQVALKITSMSVTISLSASVTIACLFTPKLYIILIHPERNVRPNMMMNRYNTTKGSVVTATNASSMMAPVTLTAVTCDQNKAVKKHIITTMDCSTQSEQYEMETKDHKNGKLPPAVITRSTQTLLNNNGTESGPVTSPVIKDISMDENLPAVKGLNLAKIGNGPISQSDVPL